jgi:hypothetical protein
MPNVLFRAAKSHPYYADEGKKATGEGEDEEARNNTLGVCYANGGVLPLGGRRGLPRVVFARSLGGRSSLLCVPPVSALSMPCALSSYLCGQLHQLACFYVLSGGAVFAFRLFLLRRDLP